MNKVPGRLVIYLGAVGYCLHSYLLFSSLEPGCAVRNVNLDSR